MARKKLTPAELVASRLDGYRKAARALELPEPTLSVWKIRNGGDIPTTVLVKHVLSTAKRLGIPFTAEEALYGGYASGAEK